MRLIDADALGIGKCNPDVFENKGHASGWNAAIDLINAAPTIDAVPIVHGKWIDENPDEPLDPRMRCSNCTCVSEPLVKWEYCPNCGAKMDGDV